MLVSMKLNELRTVLDTSEDPESLSRLANYDADERRWAREQLGAGSRHASQRAMAELEEYGIPAWESGDLAAAMAHFRNAWLLNAVLLESDPNDREAFFQLGQVEFWIGQVHFDRAELEAAERAFVAYAEITRRLVQSEPDKSEWVLEMAYALTNLGYLEIERNGNPDRILQIMQSALEYNQIALVLDPGNPDYEGELGQSLANLASAQLEVCDLDGALATTEESVAHEMASFEQGNNSVDYQWNLAAALGKRAAIYAGIGDSAGATRDLTRSLELLEALHGQQPDDLEVDMLIRDRRARLLRERGTVGEVEEAIEQFGLELEPWQSVLDTREDVGMRFQGDLISSRLSRAELLVLAQRREEALEETRLAYEQVLQITEQIPDSSIVNDQLVKASFLAWHLGEAIDETTTEDNSSLDLSVSGRSCAGALTGLRLALMKDLPSAAVDHARFLASRGYADLSYEFICSNYSVCEQ
jgi:tetratricopeptide (TPR) repeat protein